MTSTAPAKFSPGKIVISPAALKLLSAEDIQGAMEAHVCGQWGDLGREDCEENDRGLALGRRILSVYHTSAGIKFWIITEADRSVTNIFLREPHTEHEIEGIFRSRARNLVRRLNKLTQKPATREGIKLRFCVR
jgi:hypothetical protein